MRGSRLGRGALAGLLALGALGACGGDDTPLAAADKAMAGLDAGKVRLQLTATAGVDSPTAPVGFRMEGPFSTAKGTLAVLDLRYTRLLGGKEDVTQVVSTGDAVYVVAGGRVTEVPTADAARLRLGDGDGGVSELGVAGWAEDAKVQKRADGTRLVTASLDVADLLSDLARISEQAGGGTGSGLKLDADAAGRLRRLVRSSVLTVELGPDDLPRSLQAVVDFGGQVPDELRQALGPFAAARLELDLAVERLTKPLVVDKPTAGA